eukprot:3830372-Pleurochrysis_carterae.AAC.1
MAREPELRGKRVMRGKKAMREKKECVGNGTAQKNLLRGAELDSMCEHPITSDRVSRGGCWTCVCVGVGECGCVGVDGCDSAKVGVRGWADKCCHG